MRCRLPICFAAIFMAAAVLAAQPIVNLTVKERAATARYGEPVLMGVPLPESLVTDTASLALKDAGGNVVPCDFRTAAKWWRDKQSIRWLHVDFKTDIAANEAKIFTLWREPASHAYAGSKLAVTDLGTKFQVTTGPLRFTVKKKGFNLFDEAWIDETGAALFDDAHKVVNGNAKGFSLLTGGTRYYAANDTANTAVLERLGPASCVIRVEGRLKNSAGAAMYYFVCRIIAYDNSKAVKVVFTFENRDPDPSKFVSMYGLNLELPLSLSSKQYGLGAKAGAKTGTLGATDTSYLLINGYEKFYYGLNGVVTDSGNTRLDKSNDLGMAWLTDGTKGVGVSTQWFWQQYPASVEVNGAGEINIGLFSHRFFGGSTAFPPRFADHYDIYSGMGRTHEIRFVFFNSDSASSLRSRLIGVNSRLWAVPPAAWYCRATQAFGPLVEKNNTALYTAANWGRVSATETAMWAAVQKCFGDQNAMLGGKDSYDYLGWGDNPHVLQAIGWLMWNGNYYDLPHLMYQHFARTLDYNVLDYAYAHSSHIQDLHQCHFEPNDGNDGACRYCPPTNHIGQDDLAPAVMVQTSHHKTQSLFEKYYLTGELRPLDVALRAVKWIKAKGTEATDLYDVECYARRSGHIMNTLIAGYKYNFDPGCLTNLNADLLALKATLGTGGIPTCAEAEQRWMTGLMTEPLVDAYTLTGNEAYASLVKQIVDSTPKVNSNMAYATGFCAQHFNNPAYLNKVYTLYQGIGDGTSFGHHEKDYVEQCRSVLMSFYYFAIPDSLKPVSTDSLPGGAIDPQALSARPNPFNPAITLSVYLKGRGTGPARVSVFNAAGVKIMEQSLPESAVQSGCREISWAGTDASGRAVASGVYLVRVERKGFALEKRITFLK